MFILFKFNWLLYILFYKITIKSRVKHLFLEIHIIMDNQLIDHV